VKALAIVGLYAVWAFPYEAWRESSPILLAIVIALVWIPVAAAWRRPTMRVIAVLALVDVALDVLSPYPPRFTVVPWEIVRALALVAASFVAPRIPARVARTLRIASLGAAAAIVTSIFVIAILGARDQEEKSDAALVLGFALADDGSPRPQLVSRVDRAVALYKAGNAPLLVLSGGAAKNRKTEASVMRDLAVARGVPDDALVLDQDARSTIENFACARPLLDARHAKRVLLVTEPWHMARAMLLAHRHGIDARSAPATSPIWESPRHAAYWLYRDANAWVRELVKQPFAAPGTCLSADCEGCRKM